MQLTNPTNAAISFEVLGHTESRILPARSSLTLKDLPAPVGVTFRRIGWRATQHPALSQYRTWAVTNHF